MAIDFIVGSPARDVDFLFREEFVENLWESLKKHNVLLLSPRRMGKTSVMYRLLDSPEKEWLVIHFNVEAFKSPSEFFINLVDAINEHQPDFLRETLGNSWDFLKGLLSSIEGVEAFQLKLNLRKKENLEISWQERSNQLMNHIMRSGKKVLFIIDEFPDMVGSMRETAPHEYQTFLHWFRNLRDKSLQHNLRWLLGGSVNLTSVLDRDGNLKLINDLKVEQLLPFSSKETREFISLSLSARNVEIEEAAIGRICELLGTAIPFFLQLLTQEIYRFWKREGKPIVTAGVVYEVFQKCLLGEMARDKLQHFRTRVDIYYPDDHKKSALHILDNLALSAKGLTRKNLFLLYRTIEDKQGSHRSIDELKQEFERLMMNLYNDYYIQEVEDNRLDFVNLLLKTWWKKYYGYELDE